MEINSHTSILYISSIDIMIKNIPKLIYLRYIDTPLEPNLNVSHL